MHRCKDRCTSSRRCLMGRIVRSTEGPEHVDARFQRSSSAVARSSVADLEQTSLRWKERESSKAPPDMKSGRSMRTCLSQAVPADHDARSLVKVKEKRSIARKKALTGGLKRSHDRIQRFGDARSAAQQRNSARDTAEQAERSRLTAVRLDVHQPTRRCQATISGILFLSRA